MFHIHLTCIIKHLVIFSSYNIRLYPTFLICCYVFSSECLAHTRIHISIEHINQLCNCKIMKYFAVFPRWGTSIKVISILHSLFTEWTESITIKIHINSVILEYHFCCIIKLLICENLWVEKIKVSYWEQFSFSFFFIVVSLNFLVLSIFLLVIDLKPMLNWFSHLFKI